MGKAASTRESAAKLNARKVGSHGSMIHSAMAAAKSSPSPTRCRTSLSHARGFVRESLGRGSPGVRRRCCGSVGHHQPRTKHCVNRLQVEDRVMRIRIQAVPGAPSIRTKALSSARFSWAVREHHWVRRQSWVVRTKTLEHDSLLTCGGTTRSTTHRYGLCFQAMMLLANLQP